MGIEGQPVTDPSRLGRPAVPALEELLGVPIRVLDEGFVRLIDYMGDDSAVVQAARVSYGAGTKRVREDRGLIRYLMQHQHTTPFEMCEIKLHVRAPMDCWRQWIRHRTANVNEYSTRYSVAIDSTQRTAPDKWRTQSGVDKQGSSEYLPREVGQQLSSAELELQNATRQVYETRLSAGVSREQARKDLPLSTYTEAYWKIDLHNLLHFLDLRMDDHAQEEIRAYATAIGERITSRWVPLVWEAFMDYRRKATRLSRLETDIVRALIGQRPEEARTLAADAGLLKASKTGGLVRNREREEIEARLRRFGLTAPW